MLSFVSVDMIFCLSLKPADGSRDSRKWAEVKELNRPLWIRVRVALLGPHTSSPVLRPMLWFMPRS